MGKNVQSYLKGTMDD